MPLQSVPDPFDDETHRQLDALVNNALDNKVEDSLGPLEMHYLLSTIVERSNGVLDRTLSWRSRGLLRTYDELQDMLRDAWTRKSYREIRCLALLQGIATTPNYVDPGLPDVHRRLSKAFEGEFRGAAVEGLYEYLCYNVAQFGTHYIAKICSIIQSSGTGKSRVLLELHKKDVIVLYMNLRKSGDYNGFPAQDRIPAKILTDFPESRGEYRLVCYSFFAALFELLAEQLSTLLASDKGKEGLKHWVEQMCSVSYPPRFTAREDFFTKLPAKCLEFREKMLSVDPVLIGTRKVSQMWVHYVREVFSELRKCLEKIVPKHSNGPAVVIAIDEAQGLTTRRGNYRPLDVLYTVINEYSHRGQDPRVWVVFASTNPEINEGKIPEDTKSSLFIHGSELFMPHTQLGWDQNALGFGNVAVDDIPRLRHISGYGRPLWSSLLSIPTAQSMMLETASLKLCGGEPFDAYDISHVLTVFCQRFGVNIAIGHPDSGSHVEGGIDKHLRICLGTTLDRHWKFTCYPSEPLLSCVVAHNLHQVPGDLGTALETLEKVVRHDMVDLGQRGELTSRLLWLLGKDLYVRDHLHEPCEVVTKTPDGDLLDAKVVDCQPIPVVDWLEFVFGQQIWEKTQGSLAREHFQHAFLNFSHWIRMESTTSGVEIEDRVELFEWALLHWQRTSAVQCCPQQPLIDQMIPIYFKEPSATAMPDKQRVSHIFIHNETLKRAHSKTHLSEFTRKDPSFTHLALEENRQGSDADALPYIAILADFGQPSELEVTYTEHDVDDRCLRIYAAGVDATTFPFLAKRPDVLTTLQKLVRRQQVPELDTPFGSYLAGRFEFGKSALPRHMVWEYGRSVPAQADASQ